MAVVQKCAFMTRTKRKNRIDVPSYAILAMALLLSVALAVGINNGISLYNDWDGFTYVYFSHIVSVYGMDRGISYIMNSGMPNVYFTDKYLLLAGNALIYYIMGLNGFSRGLFAMLCMIGTMVALFFVGKEVWGGRAGAISALAFGTIPAVILEVGAAGDGTAVTLFSSLAVLAMVIGRRRGDLRYYAVSALLIFIGALAGDETYMVALTIAPFVLYYSLTGGARGAMRSPAAFFVAGAAAGVLLVLLLDMALKGNPLSYFTARAAHGYYVYTPSPQFPEFLADLLPSPVPLYPFIVPSTIYPKIYPDVLGYYGYAALLCGAYLLARKVRGGKLPMVWLLITFAYLSFGIDSLSGPNFINANPRFLIVMAPPISLVVGSGLNALLDDLSTRPRSRDTAKRSAAFRYVAYLVLVLALGVAIYTVIYTVSGFDSTYAVELSPFINAGTFVKGLAAGTPLYVMTGAVNVTSMENTTRGAVAAVENATIESNWYTLMALGQFDGYNYRFNASYVGGNCGGIIGGAYVIFIDDQAYFESRYAQTGTDMGCSFSKIAVPLANGTVGSSNLGSLTVYKKLA